MDTSRIERLTRSVSILLSRRSLASALGLGALSFPHGIDARKKGKKKKKKIKRNKFGCVDVGGFCKNAGQCCSGICQGTNGKNKCKPHDTGGCQPGHAIADCGGADVDCPDGSGGACVTTTGKAAYCLNAKFNPVPPCTRDADCKPASPEAACIRCGTGTTCGLSF